MISPRRVSNGGGRRMAAMDGRRRALRIRIAAIWLVAAVPFEHAMAADWLDDSALRGSKTPSYSRWEGLNFGVHLGIANMDTDFGNSSSQQVAYILRNSTLENEASPSTWTTLPNSVTNGRSFGGFLGYSLQYDELVLGFDLAYNRASSLENSASDSLSRIVTTSDSVSHSVTISAQSSTKLVDYATLRARAGYAFGQFLPYAFAGGAVGRFNYTTSSTVTDVWTPSGGTATTFGPQTETDTKDNAIVGGFTVGLGMDVAILPNVFLRGEWEFVGFAPVNGIRSSINTGRVGLGVRF